MPLLKGKPSCPYCGGALDVMPKRSKKCPHCGQYAHVHDGTLVTSEKVQEERAIDNWMKRLGSLGVTRRSFDHHRKELARQLGFTPSVNDTIWRILNSFITSGQDHQHLSFVDQEMVYHASLEGKNPKPYQAEAARHQLLAMKEYLLPEFQKVTISTCNDGNVCSACRELENRTFTIVKRR